MSLSSAHENIMYRLIWILINSVSIWPWKSSLIMYITMYMAQLRCHSMLQHKVIHNIVRISLTLNVLPTFLFWKTSLYQVSLHHLATISSIFFILNGIDFFPWLCREWQTQLCRSPLHALACRQLRHQYRLYKVKRNNIIMSVLMFEYQSHIVTNINNGM